MSSYIDVLNKFDINSLPDLDIAVLGALELFSKTDLPKIDLQFRRPLIVGSGNAEATGRIMFNHLDAIFASESDYESKIESIEDIDGVVVVSASGSKHAPIIAGKSLEAGKKVVLITNTKDSPTFTQYSTDPNYSEYVFPKNREPYTYNTSTYMGMILGSTGEDPANIKTHLENLDFSSTDFSKFDKYFFVLSTKFSSILRMLEVKFIELFGREIARDVETIEYMKHAVTVVPTDELFVYFGIPNDEQNWGDDKHKISVPLPNDVDYAAMMAVGYFTIAQIQKAYPSLFKDNIEKYTKDASKVFGKEIKPIVE